MKTGSSLNSGILNVFLLAKTYYSKKIAESKNIAFTELLKIINFIKRKRGSSTTAPLNVNPQTQIGLNDLWNKTMQKIS